MSRRISIFLGAIVLCVVLDACQSPTAPAPRPARGLAIRGDGADTSVADSTRPAPKYPTQPWY